MPQRQNVLELGHSCSYVSRGTFSLCESFTLGHSPDFRSADSAEYFFRIGTDQPETPRRCPAFPQYFLRARDINGITSSQVCVSD